MMQASFLGLCCPRRLPALVLFCACGAAGAQAPAPLHIGPVYTSSENKDLPKFPLLDVVIEQPGNQPQPPAPSSLLLVEDGTEGKAASKVEPFESKGVGMAVAMVVDVSGSMAGRPLAIIRDSLQRFVGDARAQDSVGVMTIADDAVWDVPFGADHSTLSMHLRAIHTRGSKTRLFDGLMTALARFDDTLPARHELTVISDGHDEGSRVHLEDVVRLARERHIAIDAIGLTRSAPEYLKTLSKLAFQTGGSFHQVQSDAELQKVIAGGMLRLKSTPVATFEAQHLSGDGKEHTIVLRWMTSPELSGQTTFTTPQDSLLRKASRQPVWVYACAAAVLLALAGYVVWIRQRAAKAKAARAAAQQAYAIPAASPSPASQQRVSPPGFKTSFEGVDASPGRAAQEAGSPAGPRANRSGDAARSADLHSTRIAGIFPGSGSGIAFLEVLNGSLTGHCVEVRSRQFWIGAALENDLVLADDETVSSRHAYLLFEEPILLIVDNHSTNGTRVGGHPLNGSRQALRNGDQIQIGRILLRLKA